MCGIFQVFFIVLYAQNLSNTYGAAFESEGQENPCQSKDKH